MKIPPTEQDFENSYNVYPLQSPATSVYVGIWDDLHGPMVPWGQLWKRKQRESILPQHLNLLWKKAEKGARAPGKNRRHWCVLTASDK